VAELVEHGDPDLVAKLVHLVEVGLERAPEDRDPVRELAGRADPPVTKAAMAGRLARLVEAAEGTRVAPGAPG